MQDGHPEERNERMNVELESFNYGKRLVIYIHLQQILICCTACLQAPSISGWSIDISACSTIVSNIILQDHWR
jgi:hypothetical protein